MKRVKTLVSLLFILSVIFTLTACGKGEAAEQPAADTETKVIKAGFSAGPYADMFKEGIEPSLIEKGYTIETFEFSDYVQPNISLANEEIDVNLFQHSIYLENFKTERNLELTYIKEVPTAGMGIFSEKYDSLEDLPEGALVAIPNDVTNLSRAIRVLEQTGLVKIDPSVDSSTATHRDLSENVKKLEFVEVEAPQLPRSLEGTDAAIINGNFALAAGLNLSDALYNEKLQDGYVNVIAIRTEDESSQFAKDIIEIVESDAFKSVIEDPNNQYSSFHKPKDY